MQVKYLREAVEIVNASNVVIVEAATTSKITTTIMQVSLNKTSKF